jgi:mannosyltransferase
MKQNNQKAKIRPSAPTKSTPTAKTATPTAPPPDWPALLERHWLPIVAGILVLAFLLRVVHLSTLTLWLDEFVHVQRADQYVKGTGPLFTDDNNGILLTFLLLPVFKIAGASVFAARFISVLFGIGTLWLLYQLGTRLFNRHIGTLALFAGAVSVYMNFWSRMSRNYAIFSFFFLLTGWVFLKAFDNNESSGDDFWSRNRLSLRYLLLLPVVFVLALLSHQLAFFFVLSAGVYALAMQGMKVAFGSADRWRNPWLWLSVLALPALVIVLVPGMSEMLRQPLSGLFLSNIADMAMPKWSRIGELWATKPWEAFNVYHGVFRYDPSLLYFFGLLGFVAAFRLNKTAALWLLCSWLVPFLLLCFLYREPYLPRYAIFIFPYFLLAAAVGLYSVWKWVSEKIFPDASGFTAWAMMALPFILILASVRWKDLNNLVLAQKLEGHVVNNNISQWAFTNWQEPCRYVAANRQPGDVVMATVPNAVSWYLRDDQVLWFRQNKLDTRTKQYVPMPSAGSGNSAATFEDVVRTVQNNPRGWLLGDYYLDNIFTDEKTLMWVYRNLKYYPEASQKSGVLVFGWDNTKPGVGKQNFVTEVGRWEDRVQSRIYDLALPPELFAQNGEFLRVTVRVQNVNSNREGLLLFNGQNASWLPATGGNLEEKTFNIPKAWLQPGENTVQVLYDTDRTKDPVPGFTIHYLSIQ